MRTLGAMTSSPIERWIHETCRSEWTHWIAIIPSVFFFLWNETWVGWVMVLYALMFNLPPIIGQRYNRKRPRKMLIFIDRHTCIN